MRESVIAGFAGVSVMGATAALAAALLTWEPSIVARATASVAPAARVSATPAAMAAVAFDLSAPDLPAPDLPAPDVTAPDLPAELADTRAPTTAQPPASEPTFAALSDPAGGSFGFRSVVPLAGSATFAEPSPPPQTAATPALREMVRREMAATPAQRSILPPPRPAFREVKPPSTTLAELQPVSTASAPGWPDQPSAAAPAWPSLFGSFGDGASRATRPEKTLQSGMASWYGPGFHGRRTASGEVFDQNALTAAHRHLPFGTKVRVVDQTTGRSIVVRINDRGPFSHGRVIDLSKASAQALGMSGTARVKIVSAE